MQEDRFLKNPYYPPLRKSLEEKSDFEEKLDQIRKFKSKETKVLEQKVLSDSFDLSEISEPLSQLADAVLIASYFLAREQVRKTYGLPRFKDNDGNYLSGEFALIGMGKLGGRELHFGSDLDLIFIFNRNGETQGGRIISNQEYYARLSQRIISILTLYTRFGYAFKVDTELRPSGKAGALVTAIDPWVSYYHEYAQLWEKQALLKARLIYASGDFAKDFERLFKKLIFLTPFTEELAKEIHHYRSRMEKELAKESDRRWHFKKGYGGLVDIEFCVQFLQLKFGKIYESLVVPNTLDALKKLAERDILPAASLQVLKKAYLFYRKMEIFLELRMEFTEGYLDPKHEKVGELSKLMTYNNARQFLNAFSHYRKEVRKIYLRTLKLEPIGGK